MGFKEIRNEVVGKVSKKSPEILVGLGLAGMLTSTVLAVKATPKALDILAEEDRDGDMTNIEKVKLTWKCYIPAAVGYCTSAACIIAAASTQNKRHAMLAGAYKLSETALLEYRSKIVETLGEEKEKEIRDSIARDRVNRDRDNANEQLHNTCVIVENKGDFLCYDMLSGRYFNSSIDKIQKAVNDMNYKLLNDNILSLNEFYFELGMKPTNMGDEQGWDISKGMIEVSFGSIISENDEPCIVMYFDNAPQYGFDRFL